MRHGWMYITTCGLMLGSCGGGGGGQSTVPVVSAPLPTPTPSPTPTPTTTPAPTTSYATAFDLSQDRFFNLTGAEATAVIDTRGTGNRYTNITSVLQNSLIGPTLAYTAGSRQSVLTQANGTNETFDQSQITLQSNDRLVYQPPSGFFTFFQPGPTLGNLPVALRYVVGLVQSRQVRNAAGDLDAVERRYVGGAATAAGDVPVSGVSRYTVLLSSSSTAPTSANSFNRENGEVAIDYAAKTLTATIAATSTSSFEPTVTISLTFSGQLASAGSRINGTVTSADGGTGTFSGNLFGPAGGEVGLAFRLVRGEQHIVGTVVGFRR